MTAWAEANQRLVAAEVGRVRALLERHLGVAGDEESSAAATESRAAADAMPEPSALDAVAGAFGLTAFERDVLVLLVAHELDARVAPLCARVHDDPRRAEPTFGLALAVLPDPHWSALTPRAPLRAARLVEAGAGPLTTAPLGVDERVLHTVLGLSQLDRRLDAYLRPVPAPPELAPSQQAVADALAAYWTAGERAVQLGGADPRDRRDVAAAAAARAEAPLYAVAATDLPVTVDDRDGFLRLWHREVALDGAALLVELDDDPPEARAATRWLLDRAAGRVVVSGRERLTGTGAAVLLDVAPPTRDEQRALWQQVVPGRKTKAAQQAVDTVAARFDFAARDIRAIGATLAGRPDAAAALWDACRAHARPEFADLAERVDARATWSDLVLPDDALATLRDIVVHVRAGTLVEGWGFAERSARGLGVAALFAGGSGTGKTMAAEVLANELRLDLYRIDLSSVVSKYIGETEKNLRAVFDAADKGAAILLFDEADALFGKRTEVRDSHDRYANIEVSYLLQRMESYRGLAILTTNMRSALDDAFQRRLRFVVQFPFPDHAQRAAIWREIFPVGAPVGVLQPEALAKLAVTGGNIRNIAVAAALYAADAGEEVGLDHVRRAAEREYAKLDRPLTSRESGVLR